MRRHSLPRALTRLLCLCGLLYTFAHFYHTGVRHAWLQFSGDFLSNFPSLRIATWAGRPDWYRAYLVSGWLGPSQWGYGPLMHLVTWPLFWLPSLPTAYRAWLVANYAFLAVSGVLLYRLTLPRRMTWATLTAFVVLVGNFYPLYEALAQRNIEICELLLLLGALTAYVRRQDALAGCLTGLAAMTKFLPIIVVGYLALKRRWRAVAWALATIGIVAIITQVLLGWQHSAVIALLGEMDGGYLVTQLNQTLGGGLLRLLLLLDLLGRVDAHGLAVLCRALMAVQVGAVAAWAWRRLPSAADERLEWSLMLVAMMLLLPPHNHNYYLVFLIVPYVVMLGRRLAGTLRGWRTPALVA